MATPTIISAYEAGQTTREIAAGMAVSRETIRKALVAEGIPLRARGPRPDQALIDRNRQWIEEYLAGQTMREIAGFHGVAVNTVRRVVIQAVGKRRPPGRRLLEGTKGQKAYELRATGLSWKEVAAAFPPTSITVPETVMKLARKYAIRRGLTWPPEL